MRPATFDPTAGETAREIATHPGAPRWILDPTDPRYGRLLLGPLDRADAQNPTFVPTDVDWDELSL